MKTALNQTFYVTEYLPFYVWCTTRPYYTSLASWLRGKAFISGAGGLRFKSRAGQIEHSVVNGSPLLRHFFERGFFASRRMMRRWAPQARYTFRRNTATIIKDLV